MASDWNWPMPGGPADEFDSTLLTFKTSPLTGRFRASSFESRPSEAGQFLPLVSGSFLASHLADLELCCGVRRTVGRRYPYGGRHRQGRLA